MLDVDEENQTAEIAWIGQNLRQKDFAKENMSMINTIDSKDVFGGALCEGICPQDGQWYECSILREINPTTDDEQKMLETGDSRLMLTKFVVRFRDDSVMPQK